MRPGDFHRPRAKGRIGIFIGNDRDQTVTQRQLHHFAHNTRIARVAWVHRHRAIAQHGFGARGGDGDIVAHLSQGYPAFSVFLNVFIGFAARQNILEMPHVAVNFDILDFQVGDRGFKMRVPVDQPLAAIDQALVIHIDKNLDHGVVEIAIFAAGCPRRA